MRKIIGIDLGTANTFIYVSGRGIVFSEPTVIAFDMKSTKVLEIGYLAAKLYGRSSENIDVIKPVKNGVPARMNPIVSYLRAALQRCGIKSLKNCQVVFSVKSEITPLEKKSYMDIAKELGTGDVVFENQAMLSAIGSGVDVKSSRASMCVNIGAGSTNIGILLGNDLIVSRDSIFNGNLIDEYILRYLRKQRHMIVGNKTAEFIKMKIGSVENNAENRLLEVSGRDLLTSLPHNVTISTAEVKNILIPLVEMLTDSITDALTLIPAEMSSDVSENGLIIAGGTSLLAGLREYLEKRLNIPVRIAPDPIASPVKGIQVLEKEKALRD